MSTAIRSDAADQAVSDRAPEAARPTATGRVEWLRRHAEAVGLGVFVVLSFAWFARTWVDPVHRHAGVVGDPEAYLFALAWPPFAVAHHMNPFYTTYLLTPTGANLMWTVPPGFGLLLWPLTATIGVVPTYNLLATLSVAATAWTAQLALRRLVPGELGPFVGGLFYGFSPYMTAHSMGHVMLTVAILPPLLLLLLHEALVRRRWRPTRTGAALGALFAFQLSTFLELVAAGAVAGVLFVAVLAIAYRREIRGRVRYAGITAASAVGTFLVLAGFQLWTLFFGRQSLLHAEAFVHPPNVNVTDLLGFVVPSQLNAFAPGVLRHVASDFKATGAELNGYLGMPLLALVVVIAVRNWRVPTVRIATVFTGAMAILSMGPRLQVRGTSTIPLPWSLFARLPLMGNLLPVRLAVFTDLGVAVLVAYAIGHRVRPSTRERNLVRAVVVAAIVVTLLPSRYVLDSLSAPVNAPSYFTSSQVHRIPAGSVALVAPWTTDARNDAPELWQALSGFRFRMPSGYAYLPTDDRGLRTGVHTDLLERSLYRMSFGLPPRGFPAPVAVAELRRDLRRHEVRTVIVGPMPYQAMVVQFIEALLERAPEHTGGVYVWYDVDRVGTRSLPSAPGRATPPPP